MKRFTFTHYLHCTVCVLLTIAMSNLSSQLRRQIRHSNSLQNLESHIFWRIPFPQWVLFSNFISIIVSFHWYEWILPFSLHSFVPLTPPQLPTHGKICFVRHCITTYPIQCVNVGIVSLLQKTDATASEQCVIVCSVELLYWTHRQTVSCFVCCVCDWLFYVRQ